MGLDAGGMCWEDGDLDTIGEALARAEEYMRIEEIPDPFGPQVVREMEASLKKKKPGRSS